MLHKTRDLLVRQRTMLINALRGHLAEFGIVAAQGSGGRQGCDRSRCTRCRISGPKLLGRRCTASSISCANSSLQIEQLEARIHRLASHGRRQPTAGHHSWHRADHRQRDRRRRAGRILFRSGRQFAAWLGLTPKAHSSGGKERSAASASRATAIFAGCSSSARRRSSGWRAQETPAGTGQRKLLERKPARVVSVALANKTARIAWAVLARGEDLCGRPAAAA